MWQLQQTEPLAVSANRAPAESRVYSTNRQSLWAWSRPRSFLMIAMRPMKSLPGRTASFTRIVPLRKLPLGRRFLEA